MRLELAGTLDRPDPLVLRFDEDSVFDPTTYTDQGYTHFEVICIGGGGGMGGGIDTQNSGTLLRNTGGAGGGGGLHRVRGVLSALPMNSSIVVGAGGLKGTDHLNNPAFTTDGGNGGTSSFNTNTCCASGGMGGKRVQSNATTVSTQANGGDGGAGNRTVAGGGAAGGVAGTPTPTGPGTPGTAGVDGTFINNVGKGGGGGAGGVGKYGAITLNAATAGGRGSYNPSDLSVYGPGADPTVSTVSGAPNTVPGGASGAKAAPLNGLPTIFGQSKVGDGNPGVVILRLTAE